MSSTETSPAANFIVSRYARVLFWRKQPHSVTAGKNNAVVLRKGSIRIDMSHVMAFDLAGRIYNAGMATRRFSKDTDQYKPVMEVTPGKKVFEVVRNIVVITGASVKGSHRELFRKKLYAVLLEEDYVVLDFDGHRMELLHDQAIDISFELRRCGKEIKEHLGDENLYFSTNATLSDASENNRRASQILEI